MRKHHNKLYYGKYRHKTIFKMPGSLMFYPTTDQYLVSLKEKWKGLSDVNRLADFIIKNRKSMKFRMQDKKAIFYSDIDHAKELVNGFWDHWIGSETVDPKFNKLDKNTVGCDRLPHSKYRYQVHIKKDAHLLWSETEKSNLWNFLENSTDSCLVTNSHLIDYFEDKCPYCFGGYFYVTEEKMLTPIYIMAQKGIDKVIKFKKEKNGSNKETTR